MSSTKNKSEDAFSPSLGGGRREALRAEGGYPFFRVFLREIERMTGSTVYLFTTLIGPLFSFIILLSIFSDGVPRNLPVGVVDQDNTVLSRKAGMWIGATPEAEVVNYYPDRLEAYQEMKEGKLDAVIFIPEGTEKAILKGESGKIQVFISNANILKGGFLQKGIYKALATLSGGIKVQFAMKGGLPEEKALAKIQPVKLHQHVLFNPFGNYSYFLLTALLPLMVVIFTLLSGVYSIGIELRDGTGEDWLKHSDDSLIVALAGKLIPYTMLMFFNLMVMNFILFVQLGTPLQGSFGFLILSELLMVVCYQLIAVLLVGFTANLRLALSLASAYAMMALTFSGLTFPQVDMPLPANIFSYFFPFTHWVKIFISQAIRGEAFVHALLPATLMILFILVSLGFLPRLKKLLKEERFWGKI